ncbi:MAG TPA: NAD(P)-binding protein [Syntrophales bacterium]|nr:NAD(P)-binding protein [Syntrophales bacterium]
MADASFDVVIVGGGNKALVAGMYLQRYGGLKVGIFEKRHEVGGGWSSDESPAPGFIADHHSTFFTWLYTEILEQDFPFNERGFKFVPHYVVGGGVFLEDNEQYLLYSPFYDPNQEKTARSLGRLSQRDADTWMKIWDMWETVGRDATFRRCFNTPALKYPEQVWELDESEKLLAHPKMQALGVDPSFILRSPIEVGRDLFESDALVAGLLRITHSWLGLPPDLNGAGIAFLIAFMGMMEYGGAYGGTHTAAHAAYKCFIEDGGKAYVEQQVEKILVENGRAKVIRLADGTEIEARKAVISTLQPSQLVFELTEPDMWDWRIRRRVANLSKWRVVITWYTWALHEAPHYAESCKINPDVDRIGWMTIGTKDPEALIRNHAFRKLGMECEEPNLAVCSHPASGGDLSRVPEGKWSILTEDFVLGADKRTEKEWREYHKHHANYVIDLLGKVAPNMTWDNVIGYTPQSPYHCARLTNMAPTGNWAVLDQIPSQTGRWRPIPELARHTTPIKGLYGTGSGWPPSGGAFSAQGYTCYKVMAEDLGLDLPPNAKVRGY